MEKWIHIPFILRQRIVFTLLAGLATFAISIMVLVATGDTILLYLGGMLFIGGLCRSIMLWHISVNNRYEMITGTCISVSAIPFRKYQRIILMDEDGTETTLLLQKQSKIKIGNLYRFYFKKHNRPFFGNDYLDTSLSADSFLGYEELGALI